MREIRQSGFDEREQETEPGQTRLRRRGESPVNSHRQTTATVPVLDSTRLCTKNLSPGAGTGFLGGKIMESSSLRRSLGVLSAGNGYYRVFGIYKLFGRTRRHRLAQDHRSYRIPVPED